VDFGVAIPYFHLGMNFVVLIDIDYLVAGID
jgi:hypothetical protein